MKVYYQHRQECFEIGSASGGRIFSFSTTGQFGTHDNLADLKRSLYSEDPLVPCTYYDYLKARHKYLSDALWLNSWRMMQECKERAQADLCPVQVCEVPTLEALEA